MSLIGQHLIVVLGDLAARAREPATHGYHHREIIIGVDDVSDAGAEEVTSYHLYMGDLRELCFGLRMAEMQDCQQHARDLLATAEQRRNTQHPGLPLDEIRHHVWRPPSLPWRIAMSEARVTA